MPSNILRSQINVGHVEIPRSGQLSQEISQIKGLFTWEDPKECDYTAYRHEGMFLEPWYFQAHVLVPVFVVKMLHFTSIL